MSGKSQFVKKKINSKKKIIKRYLIFSIKKDIYSNISISFIEDKKWIAPQNCIICDRGFYMNIVSACERESVCFMDNSNKMCLSLTDIKFNCHSTDEKINFYQVCNFKNDCSDGSDEINCCMLINFKIFQITFFFHLSLFYLSFSEDFNSCPDDFTCENKQCLSSTRLSDNEKNCFDESDELLFYEKLGTKKLVDGF